MFNKYVALPLLIFTFASFISCGQSQVSTVDEQVVESIIQEPHPYGGWFCPDNLGGFPPVDIHDLTKVPIVTDRLPTKEETGNGTSLIFIDTTKYSDARALEMDLPRVATIYSRRIGANELIIVIQAVVVGNDTVVGYRFPNGGNGSAWLKEVSFLSDNEMAQLGPSPMVYVTSEISAPKEKIWKAITSTEYARNLGQKFNEKAFFETDWTEESEAYLNLDTDSIKARGIVTNFWGNIYLHIDYHYNGIHYSEKLLLSTNPEDNTTELHMVAGPFHKGAETQTKNWNNWFQEVKRLSEKG